MPTIIRYVLLTALRDRLFVALLVGIAGAAWVSSVLASTALEEQREMMLAFSAASSRLILITGITVFVVFHVRGAFDSKEIDVMLSRPISRAQLVVALWLGFSAVAALLSLIAIGAVWYVSPLNMQGFAGWSASLMLEAIIMTAVAIFTALMIRGAAVAVMACLAVYTLARMIGYFLATVQSQLLFKDNMLNKLARGAMEFLAMFVPRFDFFAKSGWRTYGFKDAGVDVSLFATQASIFIPLLLTAAIIDFKRRQF